MEHLIGLGHRRIAFLCAHDGTSTGRNRYAGYREALARHGLPLDPALVHFDYGTRENGLTGMQKVLDAAEPPTAAVCMNDLAAFGAMLGLRHRGREAGSDFSIVGCDDVREAAQWYPALTTVRNFQDEMGSRSAEFLLNRIAHPAAPTQRLLLTPALIVRGTTGPPR
jgi:LacI family transcriptional regulator